MSEETNDVRERLQEVMRTIQVILPPGTGIALFCFPFCPERPKGRIEYISNAQREDMVRMLVSWLKQTDGGKYGKHVPDDLLPPPEIRG